MALSLVACVTINIYFPAAAAEEAARTIVRDVLGEKAPTKQEKPAPESTPKVDDKQSSSEHTNSYYSSTMVRVLDFFVPPVQAAQPNIDIDSPAIRNLRSSMSGRQTGLAGYYRSGALGFTNNGLVAVRDLKLISLRDRNKVKKLVVDENGDRKSLYAEIARANGQPQWEKDIRDTFARVWVEEAPKGYWFQDAGGKWQKK
ncbi:MAG: YdbL family protein [Candidatus Thiodiazotropha sp. (ex Ustalcina ferruginea)]|nr:YdbL family protein [Candidatus Thiodiazotropha sp. (ex Ustalcina ferruginea)]